MTYAKMVEKINTAGTWFTGVFIGEILREYPKFVNDIDKKSKFIEYMHEEYGKNIDYAFDSTRTKCYAIISIIEGGKVLDAIDHVIQSNDSKVPIEAKENANALLNDIIAGKIKLPNE